jgi:cobalt-zinc-cadmium efflux system protein
VHNLIVAFRIVLEGVPSGVDYDRLKTEIKAHSGVTGIEVLRVWSLDNEHHAAEIVLATSLLTTLEEAEKLKSSLRALLTHHGIEQCVIEVQLKKS